MHHIKVAIEVRFASGWLSQNRDLITKATECTFCIITYVLRNQGLSNQAALAKGQRKNRCMSVSGTPHLQQSFSI
jgi:hypothetical protein